MSQTFNDLKIYQIGSELSYIVQQIANKLPLSEKFKLTDQILRSSRSITANIAEGFGRRNYPNDFIRFLTYAHASSEETQVHLEVIFRNGFIEQEIFSDLLKRYKNLSVRILNFIKAVKQNS